MKYFYFKNIDEKTSLLIQFYKYIELHLFNHAKDIIFRQKETRFDYFSIYNHSLPLDQENLNLLHQDEADFFNSSTFSSPTFLNIDFQLFSNFHLFFNFEFEDINVKQITFLIFVVNVTECLNN